VRQDLWYGEVYLPDDPVLPPTMKRCARCGKNHLSSSDTGTRCAPCSREMYRDSCTSKGHAKAYEAALRIVKKRRSGPVQIEHGQTFADVLRQAGIKGW